MNFKPWQTYAIIAAIIVIIGIIWFVRGNKQGSSQPQTTSEQQTPTGDKPAAKPTQTQWDVWNGTLKNSDNNTKGNYALKTKERTIYFKTSRDFSQLIGKKVNVSYEGTWQNFVLGDVTLAEQE